MTIRILFLILVLTGISGCANLNPPQQNIPQNKTLPWDNRVKALSAIQSWNLKGLIAIRQTNNGGTANLVWSQQHSRYHITLFGPLGSHSVELTGQPGKVELASADGKKATASNPEQLLAQQTGWRLPVSNLYYWIRGLPVPGMPANKKYDAFNHLTELQQAGWSIQYPRYTSVGAVDLPDKIFLSNTQLNVRIAISQWSI